MALAAGSLREWIEGSRLTLSRVTGAHVFEIGPQPGFLAQPIRAIRPADLLVLEFRFVNMQRQGGRMVRSRAGQPAYLVVTHQPQSFGEQAFHQISDQEDYTKDEHLDGHKPPRGGAPADPDQLPVQAQIRAASGPSRVAYRMPVGVNQVDRKLDALLRACREWPLRLDVGAQPDPDEPLFLGKVRLTPVARGLRESALAARNALETALGGSAVSALDAVAASLVEQAFAVPAARADGRALRRLADAGVRRAVPGGADREATRVDQVLAAIYVRAQASRRALVRAQRAGRASLLDLSRLQPDIFIQFLTPHPPGEDVTAIEMPYRLIASPLETAGFAHALAPVTHGSRTELWHSRLGTRSIRSGEIHVDDRPGVAAGRDGWDGEKLRFLWSPDYSGTALEMFTKPLDRLDRQMLVKLTAGYDELRQDGVTPFTPRAVFVRRLMLTAMGGDLEAYRKFDPRPVDVDLSAWTHRSAIGRDYYVRVEYSGFLFPFGHRATLVKLTERKFQWRTNQAGGDRIAVLRQRFFIIVRDRMIDYPGVPPQPDEGRSFPFEQVICALDGPTPDLDDPGKTPQNVVTEVAGATEEQFRMAFWPSRGGVDYRFPLVGVDRAGRKIAFEMPLIFISELKNKDPFIPLLRTHWNGTGAKTRRTPSMGGRTVRMARAEPGAEDVDLPLNEVEIRADDPTSPLPTVPAKALQQFPCFWEFKAKLAAIERLTGESRVERLRYFQPYLDGLKPASSVFAEIVGGAKLAFGSGPPSSTVGGIATPDLTPTGLSASHGVASGDLDIFSSGQFVPAQFFPDAKLLGFFSLSDLLRSLPLDDKGDTPKITSTELPDRIRTTFSLTQTLADGETIKGLFLGAGGQSVFSLDTRIDAPFAAAAPETSVTGSLTNFRISFLGALIIHFDRLRFFTRPGAKPDVDVDLNPQSGVTFGGPLEFINRLKDFIPANGFSDPPNLDVTPAGITAGYTLGLPSIQVGILSLSNISLGAAFSLPFTGDPPTARFNFAERQNTFNLTVSMFGGGGFVALVASAKEIREIEAQLDFGAQIAINLGVASGSVYVKGGFYFHFASDRVEFEGFVELGGRLSVLGLISVSLTFHLGLTYELLQKSANGGIRASRLFGQATLTVEIDILFFSASVDVTVEKTFVGSEADPTFLDLVPHQALWDEYCDAFA